MPALAYLLLIIVAMLAAIAQALILDQWDLRQLAAYIVAYTLLLIIPPAIVAYLKKEKK